jgi:hypothetical protein
MDPTQPFMVEEGKEYEMHLKSRIHKYRARKPLSAAEIEERKRQGQYKKGEEDMVELGLNSLSVL